MPICEEQYGFQKECTINNKINNHSVTIQAATNDILRVGNRIQSQKARRNF